MFGEARKNKPELLCKGLFFNIMLKIQENIPLKNFTTFRIGGVARYFVVAKNEEDLREAFSFAKSRKLPIVTLGGGSNLLVSDHGFPGLIIKNEIKGIKFTDLPAGKITLEVGAGEILDEIVSLTVLRKLFGLENLSGIPGTVGGAAVQDAGAYGVEIKDCLQSAEGLNSVNGKKFVFSNLDCQYSYRDSFLKKNKKFVITSVTFILSKQPACKLDYAGFKELLSAEKDLTSENIREVVLKIRGEKLPDWREIGTAGSFFKNPIITADKYIELQERFPKIPGFPELRGRIKVPLAWILDNICGLKGYKEEKAGLYDKQPLVLVNLGQATFQDIINLSNKVKNIVKEKTGIEIKEEVEIII